MQTTRRQLSMYVPGNCLSSTSRLPEVTSITFPTICLIEQKGSEPWKRLQTFELPG
jgi:hypothetical protein